MDYDARFYGDTFEGLGAYDCAAIALAVKCCSTTKLLKVPLGVTCSFADTRISRKSLTRLRMHHPLRVMNYVNANNYYNDYVDAANAGDEPLADRNYTTYNRYFNTYFERIG